ncbi:hypothetical protein HanRHA438_Chr08g0359251 [Helianthus annuus]|nr:hypothetical protein HanRHA438_Chr08g0359251 [Helianthus annuus]
MITQINLGYILTLQNWFSPSAHRHRDLRPPDSGDRQRNTAIRRDRHFLNPLSPPTPPHPQHQHHNQRRQQNPTGHRPTNPPPPIPPSPTTTTITTGNRILRHMLRRRRRHRRRRILNNYPNMPLCYTTTNTPIQHMIKHNPTK